MVVTSSSSFSESSVSNANEMGYTSINSNNSLVHPNRYQVLINDSNSNFENEFHSAGITKSTIPKKKNSDHKFSKKRPSPVINKFPENDKDQVKPLKTVPENTSYANITRHGKKILLISDSILGRIQMKLLNRELKSGFAHRKYFPGAKPDDISEYCLRTLRKDKYDVVIIHAGTSCLYNDDIENTANEIFNIVKVCRENGVNEVLVSGLTFKHNYAAKVRDLNNLIYSHKDIYNFLFIRNDNILANDIGRDGIHLNYEGIVKIANNIIHTLNTLHT